MLVRKLRLQRGWTQDQLAEIADLSVRTIQRIERGGPASLETARALASAFEVDVSLFNAEPEGEPDMPAATETGVKADEAAALAYAKTVKDFWTGVAVLAILVTAFAFAGAFDEPRTYLVFGAIGVGITIQGLFVYEVLRWPFADLERQIVERRLGRKL